MASALDVGTHTPSLLVAFFGVLDRGILGTHQRLNALVEQLRRHFSVTVGCFDVAMSAVDGMPRCFHARQLLGCDVYVAHSEALVRQTLARTRTVQFDRRVYSARTNANAMVQLYNEQMVSDYVRVHAGRYEYVVASSADLLYMDRLNLTAVLRLQPGEVLTSTQQDGANGYTNGFYIGAPDSIQRITSRLRDLNHLLTEVRDYEFLLRAAFVHHNITRVRLEPWYFMKIRASCQAVWPVTYVSRIGVRASTRRYYNAVRNATAFTWKPSAPSFLDGVRNRSCACATPARSPPTHALHPLTATSECLRLRRAPPDVCTDEWTSDGCLRSPVRLRIPHATVEACFRCCMLHATAPLRANAAFWRRAWLAESRDPWGKGAAGKARGALGRALGFDDDVSVLLTALSGARHADAGATYANATLLAAPLWQSRARPVYTYIHGWGPRAAAALQDWWRVRPTGPHVLHTSGAQPLPERHTLPRLEGSGAQLQRWWVTNPAVAHPRLSAFPRGVKSSARWHAALRFSRFATPGDTERDRPTLLFCSCMSLKTHAERPRKLAALRANGFACEPSSDRCHSSGGGADSDYYLQQLFGARFTASPRGAGQQNHRDWEALLAGSVPLVDHAPLLEPLYAGLPVVMVRNWSAVTPAFLYTTWLEMADRQSEWAKLYFPYWLDRLGIAGRRTR